LFAQQRQEVSQQKQEKVSKAIEEQDETNVVPVGVDPALKTERNQTTPQRQQA